MRISDAEHLDWILGRIGRLDPALLPLGKASGLTLARTVESPSELPIWDNSAMDGYALRAADIVAATERDPAALALVGEVAAGSAEDPRIGPGEAVRIMTGAPLPSDADTVVPVEETVPLDGGADPASAEPRGTWAERRVGILRPFAAVANVRRSGEDVRAGEALAEAGERLGPARLAALAAAGVTEALVRPRPRIGIVVTGSELTPPGARLERGQIPESNSVLLSALAAEEGVELVAVEVCSDDVPSLRERLARLAGSCDVVITSGGVGPGRHDIVRIALEEEPEVRAVRVAVKPGQPQCTGRLAAGAWIFALPGNPVSAAVSFELFVRPALRALQGRSDTAKLRIPATAELGWRGAAGRLQVLPVRITQGAGGLACRPAVDPRGVSHAVGRHGGSDGYALVGPDRGDIAPGDPVDVILSGAGS
ncbi:molybdopterin molybdotransferase MoeA [Leucobacter luti]|uniref:molybdopterin molybdotransferase MoeA n=1 Tax=Leucobacter luti TaxID=340320 RepID=UPI003D019EF2